MFFDHNFTEWFMRQSQTHFALRRYRKKSRAKCCGRTDPFLFCWSFAFLLTLALLVLACNRRRICCQYNHFQGMSYSQFNKRRSNSFPSKARGSDPAISRQTILAFFSDEIDPDFSYKSWQFNGQQKVYVRWPKIWKPSRQDVGSFEDWRKFGDLQKFDQFFNLGSLLLYVTCWQIFHLDKQEKLYYDSDFRLRSIQKRDLGTTFSRRAGNTQSMYFLIRRLKFHTAGLAYHVLSSSFLTHPALKLPWIIWGSFTYFSVSELKLWHVMKLQDRIKPYKCRRTSAHFDKGDVVL